MAVFGVGLDVVAESVAVLLRHHHVADHDVGNRDLEILPCFESVRSHDHVVFVRQDVGEEGADFGIVLGDQHVRLSGNELPLLDFSGQRRIFRDPRSVADLAFVVGVAAYGDGKLEHGPLSGRCRSVAQLPLVKLCETLGIIEPYAAAARCRFLLLHVEPFEAVEDLAALLLGYAYSVVLDLEHGVPAVGTQDYADSTRLGSVFAGVADQVHENLLQLEAVGEAADSSGDVGFKLQRLLHGGETEVVCDSEDERTDVRLRYPQRFVLVAGGGTVHDLLAYEPESFGVPFHRVDVSSVLVAESRTLAQLAQRPDYQGEGSAELVRDIGDEVQMLLLESQFPASHAVFEVYVDEQERRACEYQHIGDFRSAACPWRRMHDQRHV